MTATERNSLLILFGLGVVGHGVRIWALAPADAPGAVSILAQLPPADLGAQRARALRAGRPLAAGEQVDLNTASAEEIARLPKVGLAAAKSWVRARQESGGFATLDDVDRIPGVGPGLLAAIAGHVTLGDTARARRSKDEAKARSREGSVAISVEPDHRPALAPLVAQDRGGKRRRGTGLPDGPRPPVRLNQASAAELETLPGIGPTRAKAIVAYRQTNGPFASVSDLEKIPGLPLRVVRQLGAQVVIP